MKRNEGKELRRGILRLALAVFSSIGCITVTMCLYHIREKQSSLVLKRSSDAEWGKQSDLVLETSSDIEWENRDLLLSEKRKELEILREETQLLQIKYDLQKLVKEKYDEEDPRSKYEKYFHIEQGELARIEGIEDLQNCGTFGFLNVHFSGVTFEISKGLLVQYGNDVIGSVWESYEPHTLIITDAETNLGFMGPERAWILQRFRKMLCRKKFSKVLCIFMKSLRITCSIRMRFINIHSSLIMKMEADPGCW